MSDLDKDNNLTKAKTFFERAEEVAVTNNFDYAIEMYLEGLKHAPDTVEEGHMGLRKLAFVRQGQGKKKPSMVDKVKYRGGKDPLEEMLNAEYLLARDPEHLPYAEALLKACAAGGYKKTAAWIAQILFDTNRKSDKPSLGTFLLLKDSYASVEMYSQAIEACKCAIELKPGDASLHDEIRDLCARKTVKDGKYGQAEDFRSSIKNREKQEKLHSQESVIKSADFRKSALEEAKNAFKENPNSAVNILKLAEAHFDLETDKGYKDAIKVLQDAYSKFKDFAFKRRTGELQTRKFKTIIRITKEALDANPENRELKNKLEEMLEKFSKLELEHFRLCVANYPTDLHMKYEYGLRLLVTKQYNEAIPMFQEAQKDPQRKLLAMDKMGLCFFFKGWRADAIDIFSRGLESCEVKGSAIAKDLRYNLARSFEENKQPEKALEIYRKLAQLDFGYQDVSQRVDKLRNTNGVND